MAGNLLVSISRDERELAVFRSRRMYQTDLQSDLAAAENRGRAEGILTALQNLMDSMGLKMDQAMNALKVPEVDRPQYCDLIGK